jgi:trehalose/maltose hydrolase-like predicted phosphorylase
LPGGGTLALRAERFASLDDLHLLVQRIELLADRDCVVELEQGIDARVWDINGPHFKSITLKGSASGHSAESRTNEGARVWVATAVQGLPKAGRPVRQGSLLALRSRIALKKGEPQAFLKVASVWTSLDKGASAARAAASARQGLALGALELLTRHQAAWAARWAEADVQVGGDAKGQKALR